MALKSEENEFMDMKTISDYSSTDENTSDNDCDQSSDDSFPTNCDRKRNVVKRLNTCSSNAKKTKSTKQRKPTRIPDPNTFNRNALMARENRRRKKEYVEKLEKEIDVFRWTNKNLRKMHEKQNKIIKKLQDEKRYYRNVLKNKSELTAIIGSIKTNISPSLFLTKETPETSPTYSFTDSINNNFDDLGTDINADVFLSDQTFHTDYFFTDYNLPLGSHDSWENLLGYDSPFANTVDQTNTSEVKTNKNILELQCNINGEHNYFNPVKSENEDNFENAGVCLHIKKGGKISLEFCTTCHKNSSTK